MRNLTRIDRDGAKVSRSPMTAMVRTSLSDCLSSKALIVVLILAQALFLLPGLAGYPTLSDLAIGQEQASQTLEILLTGMESGAYDSAPDALKDINARELEALTAASNAPSPSKEFFIAYAQYYDVEIECAKLGHTESTPSLYARSELIHRLAGLENPEVYASATEMPATYYLAFVVGLMPGIILLLPVALLTSGSQRRLGGRTLVSMAPVSRASERLACTAVASVLSLACLAAALLPAALLAATKNGIGDFAYPRSEHHRWGRELKHHRGCARKGRHAHDVCVAHGSRTRRGGRIHPEGRETVARVCPPRVHMLPQPVKLTLP